MTARYQSVNSGRILADVARWAANRSPEVGKRAKLPVHEPNVGDDGKKTPSGMPRASSAEQLRYGFAKWAAGNFPLFKRREPLAI